MIKRIVVKTINNIRHYKIWRIIIRHYKIRCMIIRNKEIYFKFWGGDGSVVFNQYLNSRVPSLLHLVSWYCQPSLGTCNRSLSLLAIHPLPSVMFCPTNHLSVPALIKLLVYLWLMTKSSSDPSCIYRLPLDLDIIHEIELPHQLWVLDWSSTMRYDSNTCRGSEVVHPCLLIIQLLLCKGNSEVREQLMLGFVKTSDDQIWILESNSYHNVHP